MKIKLPKLISLIRGGRTIIKIIDYSNNSVVYFDSTIDDFFDKDMNIVMGDCEVDAIDYKDGRYIIEVHSDDIDCFFDEEIYYRNYEVIAHE